jgi:SAM-dependent methyltransferase
MSSTQSDPYYDSESSVYSQKRYEGVTKTYTQFFFKNRLAILKRQLQKHLGGSKNLKLLDIGCADGVITRSIAKEFPDIFSALVGVDISTPMIEVARRMTNDPKISYFVKDGEAYGSVIPPHNFDVALGMGYLTTNIFDSEVAYLRENLKPGGIYICTLTAKDSLHARFKLKDAPYRIHYTSYAEYENLLKRRFHIIEAVPNGLFVPKLWAIPALGRILQPVLRTLFAPFFPNLFHEMIYVLRLL